MRKYKKFIAKLRKLEVGEDLLERINSTNIEDIMRDFDEETRGETNPVVIQASAYIAIGKYIVSQDPRESEFYRLTEPKKPKDPNEDIKTDIISKEQLQKRLIKLIMMEEGISKEEKEAEIKKILEERY